CPSPQQSKRVLEDTDHDLERSSRVRIIEKSDQWTRQEFGVLKRTINQLATCKAQLEDLSHAKNFLAEELERSMRELNQQAEANKEQELRFRDSFEEMKAERDFFK
ncbi:hypothetical protein BT96DRAFT_952302, partial [Gymnopus androsaceus JB14]